jgi:hypothetical protein
MRGYATAEVSIDANPSACHVARVEPGTRTRIRTAILFSLCAALRFASLLYSTISRLGRLFSSTPISPFYSSPPCLPPRPGPPPPNITALRTHELDVVARLVFPDLTHVSRANGLPPITYFLSYALLVTLWPSDPVRTLHSDSDFHTVLLFPATFITQMLFISPRRLSLFECSSRFNSTRERRTKKKRRKHFSIIMTWLP